MGCVQSQSKIKRKKTKSKKLKSSLAIDCTKSIKLQDDSMHILKSNLNELSIRLAKLNNDLLNGSDTIYDYCCELKRLVQLKKEKQISYLKQEHNIDINADESELNLFLKTKIKSINSLYQNQIEKIEKYEKETQQSFSTNNTNIQYFLNDLKKMNIFIKFYSSQFDTNTEDLTLNYSKIDLKLKRLESELDELTQEAHLFLFNDYLLEFDSSQEECIQTKEFINFKTLNFVRIPFESIDNSGSFAKFELLDNENYLVIYKLKDETNDNAYHRGDMSLLIFNQNESKLKKRIILRDCFISCIKHVNNSIAISCSTKHAHLILIFDLKLNLKHKIDCKSTNLVAANDAYLYCSDFFNYDKLINKAYDWNLNKCEPNLKFQLVESSKPFFIDTKPSYLDQIELRNERVFVSFLNSDDTKSLLIFSQTGSLIKSIQMDRLSKFKTGANDSLIVLDTNKLVFYDSNGCLLKSKQLILTKKYFKHLSNLKFLIDKKNCLHILNAYNLNIYKHYYD